MLSPNPGQTNLPFSSTRNQLTAKIFGGLRIRAAGVHPVAEIVAHVVAAEGEHGEGVAAQDADRPGRGGRRLRARPGAHEHAVGPVEGLDRPGA